MFDCVAEAQAGAFMSFLGIVLSFRTPKKSKGTDYVMNVMLADDSGDGSFTKYISINIFRESLDDFPRRITLGNVIAVKGVRCSSFEKTMQGVSSFKFGFCLLAFDTEQSAMRIVEESRTERVLPESRNFLMKEATQLYAKFSHTSRGIRMGFGEGAFGHVHTRNQLKSAAELRCEEMRFDFVGEVLAVVRSVAASCQTFVHVTDYTQSSLLVDAASIEGVALPSPFDAPAAAAASSVKIIAICTFWDENADEAVEKLRIGDVVRCRGLHARPMGVGSETRLVFSLHGNRSEGGRRTIEPTYNCFLRLDPAEHVEARDLFARKEAFVRMYTQQTPTSPQAHAKTASAAANDGLRSADSVTEAAIAAKFTSISQRPSQKKQLTSPSAVALQLLKRPRIAVDSRFFFRFSDVINMARPSAAFPLKFVCRFAIIGAFPHSAARTIGVVCSACSRVSFECNGWRKCVGCGASTVSQKSLRFLAVFRVRDADSQENGAEDHVILDAEAIEYFYGAAAQAALLRFEGGQLDAVSAALLDARTREIIDARLVYTGVVVCGRVQSDGALRFLLKSVLECSRLGVADEGQEIDAADPFA